MPHKNIIGKAICSVCKGNGFIRDKESNTNIKKQTIDEFLSEVNTVSWQKQNE